MFGFEIESARFCELIADVTKHMRHYVFKYIDGFIIFSTDTNRHIQHLYNVFEALDSFGLKLTRKYVLKTA